MASMFANVRGLGRYAALMALTALAMEGCVTGTATYSPSAGPAKTTSMSALPTIAPDDTVSDPGQATPTGAPADLSNIPPAPVGAWKSIRWVQVPGTFVGAPPSPGPGSSASAGSQTFGIYGWSRGFVGFSAQMWLSTSSGMWDGGPTVATISTIHSEDGVHWHDGTVLQHPMLNDNLEVTGVFEGPSRLLAVGISGACGTGWVEALWTSADGISWQKVDTKKAFGNATIENVSGGSSGFVATDAAGRAVWTSRDGQSWRSVNLAASAFAGARIDGGTASSGGYVLAGSTVPVGPVSCSPALADPSARPTPPPPMRSPAVWWSADGANWTKAQLPDATPAYSVAMQVCRANVQTLVAFESYGSDGNFGSALWTSNDGRTWKSPGWPPGLDPTQFLTDGRHGIVLSVVHPADGSSNSEGMSISTVTDDGSMAVMAQQGNRPPYVTNGDSVGKWAIGPTGILWADGDQWSSNPQLWIGLPS